MPFIRPEEGFDPASEEPIYGDTEYVPPEAYRYQDVTDDLGGTAKVMRDLLLALGATELQVNYDGGNDEGFSHPQSLQVGGAIRPVESVARDLNRPDVLEKLRASQSNINRFGMQEPDDQATISNAIEDLAEELAARLLGRGYGTGEYTMYGSFVADLRTFQITDNPDAQAPAGQ